MLVCTLVIRARASVSSIYVISFCLDLCDTNIFFKISKLLIIATYSTLYVILK